MKAIVSITLDDEFVVHDIKVIEGEKGLFIAMPSKKATDGEYRDIAHPINSSTRENLQRVILESYEKHWRSRKRQSKLHRINNKSCCQQSDLWQQLFKLQLSFIPRTKIRNADKHIIRFQIADDRSIPGNRRFSGIVLWCLLHCRLPREECRILFRQDFHRVTASSALCCSFRRSVQRKCGSGL